MSTAAPWLNHQEQLGAAERASFCRSALSGRDIHRIRLQEPVGLLPEADFHRVAEQPAIADDPVYLRSCPVSMLAWAVQVTAGTTSWRGRDQPDLANA